MNGLDDAITATVMRAATVGVRQALADAAVAGTGPLLYSVDAAADVLGCSPQSVYQLLDEGQLVAVDGPGRGRQITRRALVDYVDRLHAGTQHVRGVA